MNLPNGPNHAFGAMLIGAGQYHPRPDGCVVAQGHVAFEAMQVEIETQALNQQGSVDIGAHQLIVIG